jgi:hypothetical protein
VPARFLLEREHKDKAIVCRSDRCAVFGNVLDVRDNCNDRESDIRLYTRLEWPVDDGFKWPFDGVYEFDDHAFDVEESVRYNADTRDCIINFKVKEIEVFEIAN